MEVASGDPIFRYGIVSQALRAYSKTLELCLASPPGRAALVIVADPDSVASHFLREVHGRPDLHISGNMT
jgi:hypothetical protein